VFGVRSGPESEHRVMSAVSYILITRTEVLSSVPRIVVAFVEIIVVVLTIVHSFASLSASLNSTLSVIDLFVVVMNSTVLEVNAIGLLSHLIVEKHMMTDNIVAEDKYVLDVVVVDYGTVGLPSSQLLLHSIRINLRFYPIF
jgi:hypothetical protein